MIILIFSACSDDVVAPPIEEDSNWSAAKLDSISVTEGESIYYRLDTGVSQSTVADWDIAFSTIRIKVSDALTINNPGARINSTLGVEAAIIKNVDFDKSGEKEIFDSLQALAVKRQDLRREAALFHLKAAYVLRLIENPREQKNLSDFSQVTTEYYLRQLVSYDCGDRSALAIIKTKEGIIYTRNGLLQRSTTQIAREIFGLSNPWFWTRRNQ